jgi:CheY-like chemotaxis protein
MAEMACRVLVVDDNTDVADSLAILLRMEGHEVTVINDGIHALLAIEEWRPEVALLDIGLPGMDGYEIARQVRSRQIPVTLIAVTGWGQAGAKEHAAAAGFDHHLVKPVEPETITTLCSRVLTRADTGATSA